MKRVASKIVGTFCIFIVLFLVISESGYTLENDYVVMDLNIITSTAEYFTEFFKQFYYLVIIAAVLSLINFIPWRLSRSSKEFDFNKGIVHMAILIPCLIFGGGIFGLLSDQIGRGTYSNDRTLLIMMSAFVIPLGIVGVYVVLTSLVYNISSNGIFAGIGITIVQLILVMTVIYAAGLVLFTLFAGTKSIMEGKKY